MSKAFYDYLFCLQECTDIQDGIILLDQAADHDDVSLKEYLHLRFVFDLVDWDSFVKE